ncbi:pyridoxamine 5'-phosphate oxidase family protein [Halostagnicola bangensis]
MTINELTDYGMERMTDEEIEQFLETRSLGIIGLPTGEAPYLVPMSYGYDGGSTLYFIYVVGSESRKATLSDQADTVSFLVYSAETMFHWRSVLATGSLRQLSEDELSTVSDAQTPIWRPELLETASEIESTQVYELTVDEWTGIRHAIEPPTFAQRSSREQSN